MAMFLHETAPQTFKVSLRSKERVDVSRIAKYFGGGGQTPAPIPVNTATAAPIAIIASMFFVLL